MSQIIRPNKPSSGNPPEWIAGADILAEELDADMDTIYTDYNGNITDYNIAAGAAINGTKIAAAPSGIPTDRLNSDSVTTIKILNLNVTKAKLAAASVSADKLDYIETSNPGVINLPLGTDVFYDTGIAHATRQAINYWFDNFASSRIQSWLQKGATNWLILLRQDVFGVGANIPIGKLVFLHIAKS